MMVRHNSYGLGLVAKPKFRSSKKFIRRDFIEAKVSKFIDDEIYRTTHVNFGKYKLVMFTMAKLMELETTEQNKVALYLFNNIILNYNG